MVLLCNCAVIKRRHKTTNEPFSPYRAAFGEHLLSKQREHERLVNQLRYLKAIDWNYVIPAHIKESESSSS
jgi:hypothetical protein